jgi:hypothetical protein
VVGTLKPGGRRGVSASSVTVILTSLEDFSRSGTALHFLRPKNSRYRKSKQDKSQIRKVVYCFGFSAQDLQKKGVRPL